MNSPVTCSVSPYTFASPMVGSPLRYTVSKSSNCAEEDSNVNSPGSLNSTQLNSLSRKWDQFVWDPVKDALPRQRTGMPNSGSIVSCPELNCASKHGTMAQGLSGGPPVKQKRRLSRSGPATLETLGHKLAAPFRRHKLSTTPEQIPAASPSSSPPWGRRLELPRIYDGENRRRRARESGEHESDCGATSSLSSLSSTPLAGEVAAPLAVGGLMIAAQELDRLSALAGERVARDETSWEE